MAAAALQPARPVPAQLGFLAIYNPSLGTSDETLDDQIVYYASVSTQAAAQCSAASRRRNRRRNRHPSHPTESLSPDERHERLRQIGLAQAMVTFSSGFSNGAPVDVIETEQSRAIVHELEPGWWLLASIDLNKVPLPPRLPTKATARPEDRFEYSARDVKPPSLLLCDLLRAHCIFLLHHGTSLSALFVRYRRTRFVAILSRYWDLFLSTWSVTLHGNPARDMFGGINIAASGELGVGVGEEGRGSGEREVLEGLVGRIEGLVDLVVSRFGDDEAVDDKQPWLGTGREPEAGDGAIFLGTGALSRQSLKHVTHWMEDLYTWGEHAYGVIDSPTSMRRAKARVSASKPQELGDSLQRADQTPPRQKQQTGGEGRDDGSKDDGGRDDGSKDNNNKDDESKDNSSKDDESKHVAESSSEANPDSPAKAKAEEPDTASRQSQDGRFDKMLSYMKLGYGSYWTLPGTGSSGENSASEKPSTKQAKGDGPAGKAASPDDATGHYLIGLRGEIEEAAAETSAGASPGSSGGEDDPNSRTVLRTVHVELEDGESDSERAEETVIRDFTHPASPLTQSQVMGNMMPGFHSLDLNKAQKLRLVVYVNRPFVYVFLFRLHTDSLAWDALYRSLHYQLAPLRRPLLASTRYRPDGDAHDDIMSLVWDPTSFAVHCSVPNIPAPGSGECPDDDAAAGAQQPWSRLDALGTHLSLVNLHASTRRAAARGAESSLKTSRGWWIVWTRLGAAPPPLQQLYNHNSLDTIDEPTPPSPHSSSASDAAEDTPSPPLLQAGKEVFLVRRASDHVGLRRLKANGADGAARLVQGIGIDTRRYVEDLLSLL